MYIVKDFEDLGKFISGINQGIDAVIAYDSRVSNIEILDEKIKISNLNLKQELKDKKELYVNTRYLFIRKSEITNCLTNNCIPIDKMSIKEISEFEKEIMKVPLYTLEQLSGITGLDVPNIAKSFSTPINQLRKETFYLVEVFKIEDYPSPVQLLRYVRKHCNETEAIQINAYIQDCHEIVNEYLEKNNPDRIRKNLDGVYLQIFQRVLEKVIDYQCLMHVRSIIDIFIKDFNEKKYMNCFKYERLILYALEKNSKN